MTYPEEIRAYQMEALTNNNANRWRELENSWYCLQWRIKAFELEINDKPLYDKVMKGEYILTRELLQSFPIKGQTRAKASAKG